VRVVARRTVERLLIAITGIDELQTLLSRIIERVLKLLTRTGYLIEEQGMSYLAEVESDRALTPLQAPACTYCIGV